MTRTQLAQKANTPVYNIIWYLLVLCLAVYSQHQPQMASNADWNRLYERELNQDTREKLVTLYLEGPAL